MAYDPDRMETPTSGSDIPTAPIGMTWLPWAIGFPVVILGIAVWSITGGAVTDPITTSSTKPTYTDPATPENSPGSVNVPAIETPAAPRP